MHIETDAHSLQQQCLTWKKAGLSIALVPTMGFFHAGHKALMEAARKSADKMVVSLFVNPTQFGPTEDLDAYPRNTLGDTKIASELGADILFMPTSDSMYFSDHATWVDVEGLGEGLCGKSRPSHFRGVTTVVAKLFLLTQPDIAFFGEKDRQQLTIIRRMVRDLYFPINIQGVHIVREEDGLALSSRNAYLTKEERIEAPHLYKGLCLAKDMIQKGEQNIAILEDAILNYWQKNFPSGTVDYLEFVHPDSLAALGKINGSAIIATAIKTGKARLIDNIFVTQN